MKPRIRPWRALVARCGLLTASAVRAREARVQAEHDRVTADLLDDWSRETSPLHDRLARVRLAAWRPHVNATEYLELARAVLGHPLGDGDPAVLAELRAECRRLGIPVAETAEEKLARVREFAASPTLEPWAAQRLADALDPPPPPCPTCRGRGKLPDFSQGLDPIYGEPKGKPCPDCRTQETPACS